MRPDRNAGKTPAFTRLDLPLPLGPMTARKLFSTTGSCKRSSNALDHRAAAEEIGGVRLLEGAQTLVWILGLDQFEFGQVKLFQARISTVAAPRRSAS